MESSRKTYTKKKYSYFYLDAVCQRIHHELSQYNPEKSEQKSIKQYKQMIISKFSEELEVKDRRLKYWYKTYEEKGSTKKNSGRKPPYKSYDNQILAHIKQKPYLGKLSRKIVKESAKEIIWKDYPDFKGSESYVTRLILRLGLKNMEENPEDFIEMDLESENDESESSESFEENDTSMENEIKSENLSIMKPINVEKSFLSDHQIHHTSKKISHLIFRENKNDFIPSFSKVRGMNLAFFMKG